MSYKKKKMKNSRFGQLKYKLGLVKAVLLRVAKKVAPKENKMWLPQTRNIMQSLRDRAKIIRKNNMKISEWVDNYINRCILEGRRVEIITQYCLSKDLETRYKKQGNKFLPLSAEKDMFTKAIPEIISLFEKNGLGVNWYVTFNNSFLDRGRVSPKIVSSYIEMIQGLAAENESLSKSLIFFNWETDILG